MIGELEDRSIKVIQSVESEDKKWKKIHRVSDTYGTPAT